MPVKLKLSTGSKVSSPTAPTPPPQTASTPAPPTSSSTGGFKLKIKTSAPPTPATEVPPSTTSIAPLDPPPKPPKRPYNRKPTDGTPKASKRAADTDISPAAKRPAADPSGNPARRISFKLNTSSTGSSFAGGSESVLETPISAGPKIKLTKSGKPQPRRQSSGPKNITIKTKSKPPPRPVGVGYDSEASDAEPDPAIEQQFMLRMPDPARFGGKEREVVKEDADYLREKIEARLMGVPVAEGGADVTIRFVTRDLRRAVFSVRGHRYAALLVDLPCLVESMKSWDRKGGWWKVADISQMLLVLGPIEARGDVDEIVKHYSLPREVDKEMRYAHGLTPPMHWVRKRRFRQRTSYRDVEGVEEEVERLLREDKECAQRGGEVKWKVYDGDMQDMEIEEEDAEGEVVDGSLYGFGDGTQVETPQAQEDEIDDADLLAGLENMGEEEDEAGVNGVASYDSAVNSTLDVTRSSSIAAQDSTSAADTPAAEESGAGQESSSDEDDDEDIDGMDAVDEDAVEDAKEQAAKREEIEDLEREVANKRSELERTTNQLLKQRVKQNLRALEDELTMKKTAFDMEDEDDE